MVEWDIHHGNGTSTRITGLSKNNFASSVWYLTSERCDLNLDLAKASKKGEATRLYYPTRAT